MHFTSLTVFPSAVTLFGFNFFSRHVFSARCILLLNVYMPRHFKTRFSWVVVSGSGKPVYVCSIFSCYLFEVLKEVKKKTNKQTSKCVFVIEMWRFVGVESEGGRFTQQENFTSQRGAELPTSGWKPWLTFTLRLSFVVSCLIPCSPSVSHMPLLQRGSTEGWAAQKSCIYACSNLPLTSDPSLQQRVLQLNVMDVQVPECCQMRKS